MKAPCVQLRLDRDKLLKYQIEAARREMTLVDYLRDRLERAELSDELINLRVAFEGLRRNREGESATSNTIMDAALIEVLLLLRSNSTPQTIAKNHQIIREMGHEPIALQPHKFPLSL